jgi:hypothetical protein
LMPCWSFPPYLSAAVHVLQVYPRHLDVLETLDQWCGPNYRYIKVRGYDGLYILRFDETRAKWHLTMFKRARAEGI